MYVEFTASALTYQLTDGLYSPHVEAEQFEAIQAEVRSLLDSFMEKLFKEHVQVCVYTELKMRVW